MGSNEAAVYDHKKYLRGEYAPERYATEAAVAEAIAGGKVFVFRQSLGYRVIGS